MKEMKRKRVILLVACFMIMYFGCRMIKQNTRYDKVIVNVVETQKGICQA